METNSDPEEQSSPEQPTEEYVAELIDESEDVADQGADDNASEETTGDALTEEPILAEPVPEELTLAPPAVVYSPEVAPRQTAQLQNATGKPPELLENLAAKGGAVGAVVLGGLALLGSFISSYAVINAVIGLLMGLWGLNSSHQRMAGIGMLLCLISAFFCAVEISSWLAS